MEVTAGLVGVAAYHRASLDYITAFILTNGISWWGIPRVMGIKDTWPRSHVPFTM